MFVDIAAVLTIYLYTFSNAAPLTSNTSDSQGPYFHLRKPTALLGRSVGPEWLSSPIVPRGVSQDPSCPVGFLCVLENCPSDVICESGAKCFNFEGTVVCDDSKLQWCALNPLTLEAVGCNGGKCCHGNCYTADAVCCDFPTIQCTVGNLCNACNPGQTCGDNQCLNSGAQSSQSVTKSTVATRSLSATLIVSTKSPTSSTSSKPASSVQSSATPSPTVVLSVDAFQGIGCYIDSVDLRVLVAGSILTATAPGMTVEQCVAFARRGGWAYAGVEFGSECFVGNTLHNATQALQRTCNQVCNGAATEFCGNGNRIQIYQDSSWSDPTLQELIHVLEQYNSTLWRVQNMISSYQSLMSQWEAQQNGTQQKRSTTLTTTQLRERLTIIQTEATTLFPGTGNRLGKSHRTAAEQVATEFRRAASIDVERTENPFVDAPTLLEAESAADIPLSRIDSIVSSIDDNLSIVESTAADDIPLLNTRGALSAIEGVIGAIGLPGVIAAGGVIIIAATGIFALIFAIHRLLSPPSGGGGGGGDGGNPPTTTTTACHPTLTPQPMVILTQPNTLDADVKEILDLIPPGRLIKENSFPSIGYLALLATIDDCEARSLISKNSVSTVSLNAVVPARSRKSKLASRSDPSPTKHTVANLTSNILAPRDLAANKDLRFQFPAPFHLRWLSSLWAKIKSPDLTGKDFLNTDGFLFDSSAGLKPVFIYILDTGLAKASTEPNNLHIDFGNEDNSKVRPGFNARDYSNDVSDFDGHGTHMASCAAGVYFGVAKTANIVPVQVSSFPDGINVTIMDYMTGFAWSADNVVQTNMQGRAVFSASWGFDYRSLNWSIGVKNDPNDLAHSDPFPELFKEYVYSHGIVLLSAASNYLSDDAALQIPTMHGGRDKGLIVVGGADKDGKPESSVLDSSNNDIISIYANGVAVCAAYDDDLDPGDHGTLPDPTPDSYICETGTSQATAQLAGLAAYYLSKPAIQRQIVGTPAQLDLVSLNMKNFLRSIATSRKGQWADGIPRAAIDEEISCANSDLLLEVPNLGAMQRAEDVAFKLDNTHRELLDPRFGDVDLNLAFQPAASGFVVSLTRETAPCAEL